MKGTTVNIKTNNELVSQIGFDAKVSMDDLVNVFVSRHEEMLHTQRATAQAAVKSDTAAVNACVAKLVATTLAIAKQNWMGAHHDTFSIEFDCSISDNEKLTSGKPTLTVRVAETIRYFLDNCKMEYNNSTTNSRSFGIVYNVASNDIEELKNLEAIVATSKDDVLRINGQIQSIDRKTRQIKGLLAEKKLRSEGMQDLLDSPEIATILQLN
jgi:hypothetical protein